ncbi:MAG: metal ABC transporter permease [Firmicutes bacterium]|nr:metal ABC transporter permease [Bacillota bacterium]MBR3706342.1 metal ABC transporter permease [Bacillota bacterium]
MDFLEILAKIPEYLSYPFVRYAFIAGVLVALCSSLLGVTLVLKRYSFIGDGLSHVAFGAMAIAAIFSVSNELMIVMPVTIIAAILLLKGGQNAKIKGDAALAMLSVGSMAAGYLLLNMFSASANVSGDVCSTLFGSTSILTLTDRDVLVCVIMSILVICVFLLFYNKIFAITFDENFAVATGVSASLYNLLIAVITAIIIVLAMNLVGALLTSALMIFPALSAMRVFNTFRNVIICSAVVAVFSAALGILVSIMISSPVGATIVVVDLIVFGGFSLAGRLLRK